MPEIYKETNKIFSDSPQFSVPLYQREYSWQPQQIDQLIDDIDNISITIRGTNYTPDFQHFLGLLVFIKEEDEDENPRYSVVDGQQRLSTIILIASVAKDVISHILNTEEITEENRQNLLTISSLFDKYIFIESRPFGNKIPRLIPNNNDNDLYQILILEAGDLESKQNKLIDNFGKIILRKKYYKAYQHLYDHFLEKFSANRTFFTDFFVKIDSGLTFIPFVTASDTDAFILFETLNDRGIGLSALDLIKNKVLQHAEKNTSDLDDFDSDWKDIFAKDGIIPSEKAQSFIRNFLMLMNGHITNNQVYDTCKRYLTSNSSTKDFLKNLKTFSEYFRSIVIVEKTTAQTTERYVSDDDIAEKLILLNKTKVRQWQSLALSVYKYYIDKEISKNDFLTILNLLLSIAIRFKILNKRFNLLEKLLPQIANSFYTLKDDSGKDITIKEVFDNSIKKLTDIILNHVPDEECKSVLLNGFLFDDNDLAFIVLRLLADKQKQHGLTFTTNLSLEHVLPEKHEKYWGKIDNVESLKYSIGNMLLLKGNFNSQASNKNFADKKELYDSLNPIDLVTDSSLEYKNADQETWVSSFIKEREANMLNRLLDVI